MIANGLSMHEGFDPPVQHAEWFPVPGDSLQPVDRFETGHGGGEVDIYEFWWADQSRFPAAARSFLAAFVGLFLSLPSFGRTAMRKAHEIGADPAPKLTGTWRQNLDYHLLGVLSWVVAVPGVVLSAVLRTTAGALAIAIVLPEGSISGSLGVGLFGIGLSGLGLTLLRKYQNDSGRRGAVPLGAIALAGASGALRAAAGRARDRGQGHRARPCGHGCGPRRLSGTHPLARGARVGRGRDVRARGQAGRQPASPRREVHGRQADGHRPRRRSASALWGSQRWWRCSARSSGASRRRSARRCCGASKAVVDGNPTGTGTPWCSSTIPTRGR